MRPGPRQRVRPTAFRRGFTLLEVLLALGLSVLLLAVIGMAVDVHLRVLATGRAEVEQAQLARAILRRIADDLRSALQYTPAATNSSSSSPSSSDSSTSTSTTTGESGTGEPSEESMLEDQQTTDRTSNLAEATSLPALPGVYGNDHELQIDVSRVPRLDQMRSVLSSAMESGATTGISSHGIGDLRTVLYFSESTASGPQAGEGGAGLLRREMDRATAALAMTQGEGLQTQGPEESMAPEVQGIQFRYFDGTEWVDTWDSTDRSGLPLAVQIGLWLPRPQNSRGKGLSLGGIDGDSGDLQLFQLVVHLPAARATTSSSASGTDSTTSNSSTDTSTNSTSGGTTSGNSATGGSSTTSGGSTGASR